MSNKSLNPEVSLIGSISKNRKLGMVNASVNACWCHGPEGAVEKTMDAALRQSYPLLAVRKNERRKKER